MAIEVPVYYYDQDQVAVITHKCTNPKDTTTTPIDPVTGNTLVNPTNVYFVAQKPGEPATYVRGDYLSATVTRDSTGIFEISFPVDVSGTWTGRWYNKTGSWRFSSPFVLEVRADNLV